MIEDSKEELAALYACGSLTELETREFEAELRSNNELEALAFDYNETMTELTRFLPSIAPRPELKANILAKIEPTATQSQSSAASAWSLLPWGIAALFTVSMGTLLVERYALRTEMHQLQARESLAQLELLALKATGDGPKDATAVVAWDEAKKSGIIKVSNFPLAQPGRDYQLWVLDPSSKAPIDAGVLRINPDGSAEIKFRPNAPMHKAGNFAVSLEKAGGATQVQGPQGPIVMVGAGI